MQSQVWPARGACFRGKPNRAALDAPTEPIEKLVFVAFDDYRTAANAEYCNQRAVTGEFTGKPVGPLRNPRNPEDVGDRRPDELSILAGQQGSGRVGRSVW